ncbi:hypothetical protein IWQ62_000344 [Dispira parvispora]|uniref:Uncharacterized protein n=1 Tax=Dispira parvispora TaxID=1520584 RepID=A0A9W8AYK2_9FUNG|nr:hypothetical protein IWQ62_000344 [Dispira parvispora]
MASNTPELYDDTLSTLCFIYQDYTTAQSRRRNSNSSEPDNAPTNEPTHEAKRRRTDTGHTVPTDPRLALISPKHQVSTPPTRDSSPLSPEDRKQRAKKNFQEKVHLMPVDRDSGMAQLCSTVVTQSTMFVDETFRKELLDFIQLEEGVDIDSQRFPVLAKSYQWFIEVIRLEASQISSNKAGSVFLSVKVQQRRAVTVFLSQDIINTLQPRFASIYNRYFTDSQRSFVQKTTGYIWRIGRPIESSSMVPPKTPTDQKRPHISSGLNSPALLTESPSSDQGNPKARLVLPAKSFRSPSPLPVKSTESPQVDPVNEEVMLSGTQHQFSPNIVTEYRPGDKARTPTPVRMRRTLSHTPSGTTPDQPIRSKINLSQLHLHKPGALPIASSPTEKEYRDPPPLSSSTEEIRNSSSPTQRSMAAPKFTYNHPNSAVIPTVKSSPTASASLTQRASHSPDSATKSPRHSLSSPWSPQGVVHENSENYPSLSEPHLPTAAGSVMKNQAEVITSAPPNALHTSVTVPLADSSSSAMPSKYLTSHPVLPKLQPRPSAPMDGQPSLPTESRGSDHQAKHSPMASKGPGGSASGAHPGTIERSRSLHPSPSFPSTPTFAPHTPTLGTTQGQAPIPSYPWVPSSPQIQELLRRFPPGIIIHDVTQFVRYGMPTPPSRVPFTVARLAHGMGLVPITNNPPPSGSPANLPHHPTSHSPTQEHVHMPARAGVVKGPHVSQGMYPRSNMHPFSPSGNSHTPPVPGASTASTLGMQIPSPLPVMTSGDNIRPQTNVATSMNPADLMKLQMSVLKNTPIAITRTTNASSTPSPSPSVHPQPQTQSHGSPPVTITRAHTMGNTVPQTTSPTSAPVESIHRSLLSLRDALTFKLAAQEQQTQAQFRQLDERLTRLEQLMLKLLSST